MTKRLIPVSALILLIFSPALAQAGVTPITECGTVITEPGKYRLAHDLLACPGSPFGSFGGPLLIASSDVKLDLNGHTITCDSYDNDFVYAYGVFVTGGFSNVHIKNGTISGCNAGILFAGMSDSSASKITAIHSTVEHIPGADFSFGGAGIWLTDTSDIVIENSVLFYNEGSGITDGGGVGNTITHNVAHYNGAQGIILESSQDGKISCNTVASNGLVGITMTGATTTGNLVKGNVTTGNVGGITLFAATTDTMPFDNAIRHNWSYGNVLDLTENLFVGGVPSVDPNAPCQNTWWKNRFSTELGPYGCFGMPANLDEDQICALDDD